MFGIGKCKLELELLRRENGRLAQALEKSEKRAEDSEKAWRDFWAYDGKPQEGAK